MQVLILIPLELLSQPGRSAKDLKTFQIQISGPVKGPVEGCRVEMPFGETLLELIRQLGICHAEQVHGDDIIAPFGFDVNGAALDALGKIGIRKGSGCP